jgi:tetratricopeptide (TPR) repeat protein
MRSRSGRDLVPSPGISRRAAVLSLVLITALTAPPTAAARPEAAPSLAAMARLEASGRTDRDRTTLLFRGYASLGLRTEAAAVLERAIRLAAVTREEAAPLFEEIARAQSRRPDPESLLAICETALRSGVRTPFILYSHGFALRQDGRGTEGLAVLAGIPESSSVYPYALHAIGQEAADKGDFPAAAGVFARVRELCRGRPGTDGLARRAAMGQAEALLLAGRGEEAAALFEALLADAESPLARAGLLAARPGAGSPEEILPEEAAAGLPPRERILYRLFQGALARREGRFGAAAMFLSRAEKDLEAVLATTLPPGRGHAFPLPASGPGVSPEEAAWTEVLGRAAAAHDDLRERTAARLDREEPAREELEAIRADAVDLLAGLLVLNHLVAERKSGPFPPAGTENPGIEPLSQDRVDAVLDAMEEAALDGPTADRLVEAFSRKLDTLRNLAHPIRRYRLLARLERSRDEILSARTRIREMRPIAASGEGSGSAAPELFKRIGGLLRELESLGAAWDEAKTLTGRHFDIFPREAKAADIRDSAERTVHVIRKAIALDWDQSVRLLASARALEERERIAAWEREKERILRLRPVIPLQAAETFVGRARVLQESAASGWTPEALDALDKAVAFLRDGRIPSASRTGIAAGAGAIIVKETGRWEAAPARKAAGREPTLIAGILPVLDESVRAGERREETLYLAVLLRMMVRSPDAAPAARAYIRTYPASPRAADLAVRLGAGLLAEGRAADAEALLRPASAGPDPEVSAAARHLLGRIRHEEGNASGAVREISGTLAEPSLFCDTLSPFERDVLALGVRAWKTVPLEGLDRYRPVREGTCGGRILLAALGEAEEARGESDRAAQVYDVLARRFSDDEAAPSYEKKAVDSLIRRGRHREALARTVALKEKHGPGSASWEAAGPDVRNDVQAMLAATLGTIAETAFAEGIRSGSPSAMALSAAAAAQLFDLPEEVPFEDSAALRLKWAIASLRSGDRETGVALLENLLGEKRRDRVGEQAALLYAETMIAGYEKRAQSADDAAGAARLLLERFPSERAVSLALRGAEGLLGAGDHANAARIATAVRERGNPSEPASARAGLVIASAHLEAGAFPEAREAAAGILDPDPENADPGIRARAGDLYLLASLKHVEALAGREDWSRAAATLEDLAVRFPETPDYALRAAKAYRQDGDADGAVRMCRDVLRRFPGHPGAAGLVEEAGALLEMRGERPQAAAFYAEAASRLPSGPAAGSLLFRAASLARDHGRPEISRDLFERYRTQYPDPRWAAAYAALSLGLMDYGDGKAETAFRALEAGLKRLDGGVEENAPPEFIGLAAEARIVVGRFRADAFRKLKLAPPFERSLAVKERLFRRALEAFREAEKEAPLERALVAGQLSGDLLVEFGKAILLSERPRGLGAAEREAYERALRDRARSFFERARDYYAGLLDRLESEGGPFDLAVAIAHRLEETRSLLAEEPKEAAAR